MGGDDERGAGLSAALEGTSGPAVDRPLEPVAPGWWMLAGAAALLAAAVAVLPVALTTIWVHVLGYATAIFGTVGLVVFFRRRAHRRELVHGIALSTGIRVFATVLVVVGLVVGAVHIWIVADEIVRAFRR